MGREENETHDKVSMSTEEGDDDDEVEDLQKDVGHVGGRKTMMVVGSEGRKEGRREKKRHRVHVPVVSVEGRNNIFSPFQPHPGRGICVEKKTRKVF